ncbi:MAG: NUDIX domain-containing protein [Patescibacteria group bacterium]
MRHSKLAIAVHVFLIKKNKILLMKRINTGWQDNKWSVPAGRVNNGETISHTAIREAKEEVGIKIKKQNLSKPLIMHFNDKKKERIYIFFTCRSYQGIPRNLEPKTCSGIKWFKLNQLPHKLLPRHITTAWNGILKGDTYLEYGS